MSIHWPSVERVLIIRLRSIGDTVLATPSIDALRHFLPTSRIDILLEEWVAPVLDGFRSVDNVLVSGKSAIARSATARRLRRTHYDVVFNLHGGTTAGFFVGATRARHRVGFRHYRYPRLHNHLHPEPPNSGDAATSTP